MKKIRVLEIIFTPEIKGYQITAFRGAIANKIGKDSILFHNHTPDGYRYKYPLIQYKRIKKKASIICIDQGVDEIYKLFNHPDWKLNLNGTELELKIDRLNVNKFNLNVWDKMFHYRIFNWLALNTENYKKYTQYESLAEKVKLLEKILTANILSFAKGIDWYIQNKEIKVNIIDIINQKITKFKQQTRLAIDVEFKTNVFLPRHIGLGKAASHGYGVLYDVKINNKNNNKKQ